MVHDFQTCASYVKKVFSKRKICQGTKCRNFKHLLIRIRGCSSFGTVIYFCVEHELDRWLCPFSFEGSFSFMPTGNAPVSQDIINSATPQISTGVGILDNSINAILPAPNMGDSVNPIQVWIFIGTFIWIAGMVAMVIYSIAAFMKLKRSLIGAAPLKENIYLADHIPTPFVIGLFKPKIYLPSTLTDIERGFIIAHETCHIGRLDHVTRILGFAALAVHWFNPLVWVAFIGSGKDMELSCDEAVMIKMNTDIRTEYSQSRRTNQRG